MSAWKHGICSLQDEIHKHHKDTSALWSMCWMNFWCSVYNCIYLFGATTAGWDLLTFCREFPEVLPVSPRHSKPCIYDVSLSPDSRLVVF